MGFNPAQKRGAVGTDLGGEFVGPKSIAHFLMKLLQTPKGGKSEDRPDMRRGVGRFVTAGGSVASLRLPPRSVRADDRVVDTRDARRLGRVASVDKAAGTMTVHWDDGSPAERRPIETVHDPIHDPRRSFDAAPVDHPPKLDAAVGGPRRQDTPSGRMHDLVASGAVVGEDRRRALDVARSGDLSADQARASMRASSATPHPPRQTYTAELRAGVVPAHMEPSASPAAAKVARAKAPAGSFDARATKAKAGSDALAAAAPRRNLSAAQIDATDQYGIDTSYNINAALRENGGDTSKLRRPEKHGPIVEALDSAMEPLSSDVVVYRRVHGAHLFGSGEPGDQLTGDLTGRTFTDHGFVSTSSAPRSGGSMMIRILAPKGTPAISGGHLEPDEIVLGRGQTFRVVADHGKPGGTIRHIDVEVVPSAAPKAPAKPAPAKATLSAADREKRTKAMARQYASGASIDDIAAEHGVSSSTVHTSLTNSGVQLRPRGGAPAKKAAAKVAKAAPAKPVAKAPKLNVRKANAIQLVMQRQERSSYGGDFRPADRTAVDQLIQDGLLVRDGDRLSATDAGRQALDAFSGSRFEPEPVAEEIVQMNSADAIVARLQDVKATPDLRRLATSVSLQLPAGLSGDALRRYIAENIVRDRNRWSLQ